MVLIENASGVPFGVPFYKISPAVLREVFCFFKYFRNIADIYQGFGAEPQETGFMEEGQMKRSEICTFNIKPLLACFWTG